MPWSTFMACDIATSKSCDCRCRTQIDRKLAGHPQRAAFQVPVLGGLGGRADAERRHQLVEKAVEVIRSEHHHEVGVERVKRRGAAVQLAEELSLHALLGFLDARRHQAGCARRR